MLNQPTMTRAYREGYNDGLSGAEFNYGHRSSVVDAQDYFAGYERGQQDRDLI